MTYDCVIVGGGVVGLSLAWQLSGAGRRIALLDQREPGKEASWAGAGILPPANRATALHPYDQLRGLSIDLHPKWAERLQAETGIDTGFRPCGGIYLAFTPGEAAALHGFAGVLAEERIPAERLTIAALVELEPALQSPHLRDRLRAAYLLPGESQLRNPRHLQALVAACRLRGVEILAQHEVTAWQTDGKRVAAAETNRGRIGGDRFCVTAGSWTQRLLASLHVETGILPIRGQMMLFRFPQPPLRRILNEGSRYIVPRDDGHVLVGATEEEAGFDKSTTPEATADLLTFARDWLPTLAEASLEQSWAGLRPGSYDGLPYMGLVPEHENMFVAAGHFRSGLYLSPATAVVMSQLICGEEPEIDLTPFRVLR